MEQSTKQMIFLILLALAFFLIFGGLIISKARGESYALRSELIASADDSKQIFRYDASTEIEAHEKVYGDLVVRNGDLTLSGKVYGDVMVFYGNLKVKRTAAIYGHVIVVQGEIFDSKRSQIAGDILEIYGKKTKLTKRRDMRGVKKPILQFSRKSKISRRETMDGNVVILKGNVSVYGIVNGNMLVLDGNVKLKSHGLVIGHILTGDGRTYISSGGRCTGEIIDLDLAHAQHVCCGEREKIEIDDREERILERVERQYLRHRTNDEGIFRFFGNVQIDENEMIDGDVVAMKGTVELAGEVEGDVVAVFGDVILSPSAYVNGDVVSVGGKIKRRIGSTVTGDIVETTMTGTKVIQQRGRESRSKDVRARSRSRSSWKKYRERHIRRKFDDDDVPVFRYNRVEGLFLGLKIPRNHWWDDTNYNLSIFGHLGYGFSNKEARYQIGLERWFFDNLRFTLGGSLYHLTETEDTWQIPSLENSLAALFIKEDFQDFYQRKGYSFYLKQNITNAFQVSAEYRVDELENMKRETQWAIFGGHKKFKPNPLIDEMEEFKSVVAKLSLDTRNHHKHPTQGWLIQFEGLFAGPNLDNDAMIASTGEVVDFDRYVLDIRRYQPLAFGENLDIRLRAGTARGKLPLQYRFDMGGLSSLRGFDYKYFKNGDRLLLANVEYNIHGRNSGFNRIWFFDTFSLILFADAGLVWNSDNLNSYQEGFEDLTWTDLKSNIGVAISDHDGNVRLNFAKRVDVGDEPIVITFRINRAF